MTKLEIIFKDNIAYIARKDIALLFGVTPNRIIEYEKEKNFANPLKRAKLPDSKKVYYDLLYAVDWYQKNVKTKHKKSPNSAYVASDGDEVINDNTPITAENMRQIREYEEAKKARIIRQKEAFELKIKKGEYIKIDDKDRADAELLARMLEVLKQVEDNIPKLVKEFCKIDENIVKRAINKYFIKTINNLREKLSKLKVEYED